MVALEENTPLHLEAPALEKIVGHFEKLLEFAVGLVAVAAAAYKSSLLATLQPEPVAGDDVVMWFLAVLVLVLELQKGFDVVEVEWISHAHA